MDEAARGQIVSVAYEEHAVGCPRLKDVRAGCICFQKSPPYQPPTEMVSLTEIKQRLATIEQGQDNLWAKLDSMLNAITECNAKNAEELERRISKLLAKKPKRRKKR